MQNPAKANHQIPCTRHDHNGVDLRVREALAYAAGLSGGVLPVDAIVSIHDHKGSLMVTWKDPSARSTYKTVINRAWAEWGNECEVHHVISGTDPFNVAAEQVGG